MKEADFLQRIREQKLLTATQQHPGRYPRPVRTLPDDLVNEFDRQLTAVGGHFYFVKDTAETHLQLREIIHHLRQKGITLHQAVISSHPILNELALDNLLHHLELNTATLPSASFRVQDADVGLTGVEYAIASSGTIVMAASPQHPRSASLLPPVHIAIVRQNQLLPDLAALSEQLKRDFPERPSSGLALITGPSRTADIEQTLSIGVHGPGELHILMIDSQPSSIFTHFEY